MNGFLWYLVGVVLAFFGGYKVGYWICWDGQVEPLLNAINAWKQRKHGEGGFDDSGPDDDTPKPAA